MSTYIPRLLEAPLKQMAGWFPVVSLNGPRQSGKSTLVRNAFPQFEYVNLEDPQERAVAHEDPVGFLENHNAQLIIDEAQYAPNLFSAIQVAVDRENDPGQYILTGSQNFLMQRGIGQSLAGRVGLLTLLPFAFKELPMHEVSAFMFEGGYPRIHTVHIPPTAYFPSYIQTYIERDVAQLLDVRNKAAFHKFLRTCAHTAGKLLNITSLARAADIAVQTAKSWLSILQASYLIFTLEPYSANRNKRLIKTPKLYFYDTGLLCNLLQISTEQALLKNECMGSVFENLIVAETMKRRLNAGEVPELHFYRDDSKREIDLLDFTDAANPCAIEIKSSRLYHDKYARHLNTVSEELGIGKDSRFVVCRVDFSYNASSAQVMSAGDWLLR